MESLINSVIFFLCFLLLIFKINYIIENLKRCKYDEKSIIRFIYKVIYYFNIILDKINNLLKKILIMKK